MIVELDLYSGMPNPRWTLDAAASRVLDDAIARLAPAAGRPEPPAHLGYRGLVVRPDDATHGGLYVGGGHVFVDGRVLADNGRLVERSLLATAAGHVDERLLRDLPIR